MEILRDYAALIEEWGVVNAERPLRPFTAGGLLSFLHGKRGEIRNPSSPKRVEELEAEHSVQIDWAEGRVKLPDSRVMKLGKWLKKLGEAELLRAFETRKELSLQWRIDASVEGVLAMSTGRGWTSCMRLGEAYEEGPLAEVECGSAILYFYRPGSAEPCGREILRAGLLGGLPVIVRAGVLYGTGTRVPGPEISDVVRVVDPDDDGDLPVQIASAMGSRRYIDRWGDAWGVAPLEAVKQGFDGQPLVVFDYEEFAKEEVERTTHLLFTLLEGRNRDTWSVAADRERKVADLLKRYSLEELHCFFRHLATPANHITWHWGEEKISEHTDNDYYVVDNEMVPDDIWNLVGWGKRSMRFVVFKEGCDTMLVKGGRDV